MCWGNAQAESFWATLKVECYNRYWWPTKQHAKVAVGDWIERVYNRRPRHSALGMISPVEFGSRSFRRQKPLDSVSTGRGQRQSALCKQRLLCYRGVSPPILVDLADSTGRHNTALFEQL